MENSVALYSEDGGRDLGGSPTQDQGFRASQISQAAKSKPRSSEPKHKCSSSRVGRSRLLPLTGSAKEEEIKKITRNLIDAFDALPQGPEAFSNSVAVTIRTAMPLRSSNVPSASREPPMESRAPPSSEVDQEKGGRLSCFVTGSYAYVTGNA